MSDKPVHFLVDPSRLRGSWCTDGSIELADSDLAPDVGSGDLIARAPVGACEAGIDVRVDLAAEGQEFYATADGNVKLSGTAISVTPLLLIDVTSATIPATWTSTETFTSRVASDLAIR